MPTRSALQRAARPRGCAVRCTPCATPSRAGRASSGRCGSAPYPPPPSPFLFQRARGAGAARRRCSRCSGATRWPRAAAGRARRAGCRLRLDLMRSSRSAVQPPLTPRSPPASPSWRASGCCSPARTTRSASRRASRRVPSSLPRSGLPRRLGVVVALSTLRPRLSVDDKLHWLETLGLYLASGPILALALVRFQLVTADKYAAMDGFPFPAAAANRDDLMGRVHLQRFFRID